LSGKPFHLGLFGNFSGGGWNGRWAGADRKNWANGEWHVDLAQALERAGFDYMMFEDSLMVSDAYGKSMATDLKYGLYAPKHDPIPLLPVIAKRTKHIGLIATASTSFYPPFMLARTMATLSHLTDGRTGWNIVTSSEDRSAQNFGMDKLPVHDDRYDVADEYVDLVEQLWTSWEPDAAIFDRDTNTYVDHTKVHTIDFEGKHFKSRGPLNTLPPLGGRPVYCQAGASPRGRKFAAEHADTVLVTVTGIEQMKAYRADVHRLMAEAGRDPSSLKIMFVVSPIVADTIEEARDRQERSRPPIDAVLGSVAAITEVDFSEYDLDAPIDEQISTNGHQSYLRSFLGSGRTLREVATSGHVSALDLVGTPDSVASKMDEAMQEVGGDGYLITGFGSRRQLAEITDGLCAELQRRGLVRTEYSHPDLRGNLFEF
jgi:FMN-dependent oxidoreductase (nitrilotriacetate monooxygenase family)